MHTVARHTHPTDNRMMDEAQESGAKNPGAIRAKPISSGEQTATRRMGAARETRTKNPTPIRAKPIKQRRTNSKS
jgi:hypothetical protein